MTLEHFVVMSVSTIIIEKSQDQICFRLSGQQQNDFSLVLIETIFRGMCRFDCPCFWHLASNWTAELGALAAKPQKFTKRVVC